MVKPWGEARPSGRQPADCEPNTSAWPRRIGTAILLLGAGGTVAPAMAQGPPNLNQVPQGSRIPRMLPPAPPSTAPGAALPALPPPGGEVPNRAVAVTDVSVDGVTAFPPADIARYTQDLTGPAVPLPKIDA